MQLDADMRFVTTTLLVATRLAAVFLLTPLFAVAQVPGRVRLFFVLALAVVMVSGLGIAPVQVPETTGQLLRQIGNELFLGLLLAFGLFAAFGAFLFGGRILDFQMGFGVANLIDPATSAQAPLLGTALNLMAVMTFFLLDGHHMIVRGLAWSLQRVPPGGALRDLAPDAVIAQFGVMFVYGLAVVAPAVLTLLLLDIGMAVAARTMPQVNMFIVGFPLKIFMGLLMLALSLNYMGPLLERVFGSLFVYWQRIVG